MPKHIHKHDPARMKWSHHQRLFAAVETAVIEAIKAHPEYLTEAGDDYAVRSITKRVVGQIVHLWKSNPGDGMGDALSSVMDDGVDSSDSGNSPPHMGDCDKASSGMAPKSDGVVRTPSDRYGRAKMTTIRRDFDALRTAIAAHDTFATEAAWEKCERWLGAIYETRKC